MILKYYEAAKIDLDKNKLILFYGKNEGLKNEEISKIIKKNHEYEKLKYDEKEILENLDNFFNILLSQSLFGERKIIIINRSTDKFLKTINEIIDREIRDVSIIFNADMLDKKSKLRSLFEKEKKFICIPFYPDTNETLSKLTYNFLKKKNILISSENINLIIAKCNGDRETLLNELNKIEYFNKNGKKISKESIAKLTNLAENHSVSELIDHCLAKIKKKLLIF